MVDDLKAWRSKIFETAGHAFLKVENLTAVAAMEVMVVPLVGPFVAGRLSRDLDAADLALCLKILQRAVNGGDAQRGHDLDCQAVDVIRKQRAILFLQDSLDRLFLACGASLDTQDFTMLVGSPYFKASTIVETLCLIIES